MPGDEVGMQMGLQDVGNFDTLRASLFEINIDVLRRINDRTTVRAGKKVRAMGNLFDKKMFQQHNPSLLNCSVHR